MSDQITIELVPLGKSFRCTVGESLQDLLFAHGVEFPCGGLGLCKGCKIKVLGGSLPITPEDEHKLSSAELQSGWRLACRARATTDLKLDLAQWEATILSDDTVFAFTPTEGWGAAIDLGTTTIVAQLVDLRTGHVLGVQTALNNQARHGADIMSRIEFAVSEKGQPILERLVREELGSMLEVLLGAAPAPAQPLVRVVVVGNTVMHHLFSGVDVAPLSAYPFEPANPGLQRFKACDLGWQFNGDPDVCVLPCPGGFVGSDILAGILATRMHDRERPAVLLDLGTNGEIVVGNRERLLCASTAAGPAFEGANISMGMRASTGAISEVHLENGALLCHVLGNTTPRGVCGSGLVDGVAAGLELGWILPRGKLTTGDKLSLSAPVALNQRDIRELQLAKAAIAGGLKVLLQNWGTSVEEVETVYLAGAFGNYINQASARRIGLFPFTPEKVQAAGNTALLGAKMALFQKQYGDGVYADILAKTTHLSLKEDPGFHDAYVDEMLFPENGLD
jgi:uncharacterized 2Fe-2S/4Fe-4S cluster protein (DUF4445 family)